MTPDRLTAKSIFLVALEKPVEERSSFLDEVCAGDTDLRQRVERLLAAHDRPDSLAQSNLPQTADSNPQDGLASPRLTREATQGSVIGPYKLIQQLGEGGMGTVWMAQQTEPVKRLVALKIIKPGMDSKQVIARFEAERQALALMDHPNIAKVLDADTTDTGRPYFVMELVKGVQITKYCDEHHLTPRQRLELFIPVCQAIQHAHQKGIIHRDLKPSNVLVALYDGKPVPKVIDFGVAKAAGQQLTERTLVTGFGAIVGTLEYMSPEQAELNQIDIDTRSDIYSLGVLLYELLTGTTPLDRAKLKQAAFTEMLRMIREQEPPKPSTRLSESKDSLPSISAQRHMEPAKLTSVVRGELDWIVMKALDKDRNRRYETANGFAMDVQRYLADEPVQACPPSVSYRFRKFARRNKAALATGTLVAAALVIAVVTLAFSNIWVSEERDQKDAALQDRQKALKKAEDNEQVANLQRQKAQQNLKEALRVVDQMLTRVAEEKLAQVPQMEEVRRSLLLDALKFYEQFLKENSDDPALRLEAANAYRRAAGIQTHLGKPIEGEKGSLKGIELLEKLVAEFPRDPAYRMALAESHTNVAWTYSTLGRHEDQYRAFLGAFELYKGLASEFPENPVYLYRRVSSQRAVAHMLMSFGRPREAEQPLREALQFEEKHVARTDSEAGRHTLAVAYRDFGELLRNTSRPQKAEQNFRKGLDIEKQLVARAPANPEYRITLAHQQLVLAYFLRDHGQVPEAEKTFQDGIANAAKLAADFPQVTDYRLNLADQQRGLAGLFTRTNRLAEAEQKYRDALNIVDKIVQEVPARPWPHSLLVDTHLELGALLMKTGRNEDAEKAYRHAFALSEKFQRLETGFATADDHPEKEGKHATRRLARTHDALGNLLKDLNRLGEGEDHYRKALAIRDRLVKEIPSSGTYRRELADSYTQLGTFLKNNHRPQEAEAAFRQVVQLREKLIDDFPKEPEYRAQLSQWYCELAWLLKDSEPREAEKAYREAIAIQQKLVNDYPEVVEYKRVLATRYNQNLAPGSLGEFLFWASRMEESAAASRKALALLDELPSERTWWGRAHKGHALRLLAFRLWNLGKKSESENCFRDAAAVFEKLTAEIPDNPHNPAFHAGSLVDIGMRLKDTQPEASKKAFEEALDVYAKMIVKFPLGSRNWEFLNGARRYRAEILQNLGRTAEAEEALRQAVTEYEKLTAEHAAVTEYRKDIADFCFRLGAFLKGANRHKEAEAAYRKGLAAREKLAADFPQLPSYSKDLANQCVAFARLLAERKEFDEAQRVWQQAGAIRKKLAEDYAKDPSYRQDLAGYYVSLGAFFEDRKQPDQAKAALRDAEAVWQKLAAEFPNMARYHWELGSIYRKQKDTAKALAEWTKGCELEPNNANAWNLRGIAHADSGQADKALSDYTKCIELRPGSPVSWSNRALTYLKLGQRDKALADLNKALEVQPTYWHALSVRGNFHFDQKEWRKAVADYSKLVEQKPQQTAYWRNRGRAHLKLGQLDKAADDFAKVCELSADDKQIPWFELAKAYADLRNWDEAISHYTQAINVQPQSWPVWNNRGVAFLNLRQLDKALADFTSAIELKPASHHPWANRGSIYSGRQEWAKAVDDYSEAIAQNSKDAALWTRRGIAFVALKEGDKAVADFSKAIELTPNHVPTWYERARAYTTLGRWNNAVADYVKAAELAPKAPVLHNNLAWLLATCPNEKLRDAVRAVELAKKAVALAPKEGMYWNTLGVAHFRAGDWKAAITALEKSMELRKGGDSNDWFFLAMTSWQLGEKDKAREWYNRAVAWMDQQQSNNEELRRFRADAAELLKIQDHKSLKQ